MGGRASGESRRMAAMRRDVAPLERLIPRDVLAALTERQAAAVKVLLVHAWRRGRRSGGG